MVILWIYISYAFIGSIAKHPDTSDNIEQGINKHNSSKHEEIKIIFGDVGVFVSEDKVKSDEGSIS